MKSYDLGFPLSRGKKNGKWGQSDVIPVSLVNKIHKFNDLTPPFFSYSDS